jgi:hypothetical protein
MLYGLVALSLLFLITGLLITEGTAPYLLSGYNTMSPEDRQKFDLKSYLSYFKKFQLFLGLSMLIVGLVIYYLAESWIVPFMVLYPLFAFGYFVITSWKYYQKTQKTGLWIGIVVIVSSVAFVTFILQRGWHEDVLVLTHSTLAIDGQYGENLSIGDISTIQLVDQMPSLSMRTNGFSTGTVKKGFFKTTEGEIVKLVLNGTQRPIILIQKQSGEKVYYSSGQKNNKELFKNISQAFPTLVK